jgi:hypothetical protein
LIADALRRGWGAWLRVRDRDLRAKRRGLGSPIVPDTENAGNRGIHPMTETAPKGENSMKSATKRNRVAVAMRTLRIVAVGLCLVAFTTPAGAGDVMIDTFDESPEPPLLYDISPDVNPLNIVTSTSAALGGVRDLLITVDTDVSPLELKSASGVIGIGYYKFITGSGNAAYASLLYGDPAATSPTFDLVDGTNTAFAFSFDSIDGGVDDDFDVSFLDVDIFVTSFNAGVEGEAEWFSDVGDPLATEFNETSSPMDYFVPFDDFTTSFGTISFEHITSIEVRFNARVPSVPGVDFKLNQIAATVPEPTTLASAAAAIPILLGTLRIRRKRRGVG